MPYTQIVMPKGRHGRVRRLRFLRAIWHDSNALLSEFRVSLLSFGLAVFGGGWLYGELYFLARGERFSYLDLPYMMLELMILEPPHDIPPEPQLIMFWYAMPVFAIYAVGRGAADFFRIFFNRSERRDAWEEAVASTYRNHVIVLGLGHVGERVTNTLVQMGFEVVAIEQNLNEDKDHEMSGLGVPVIVGDGRNVNTLEKAGLRHASSMVIATSNDHVNLEAVMRARDLNPDIRIVARMWDAQFAKQINRFMGVEAVLSSSDLAAPAFAGAAVGIEITQTIVVDGVDYSMIRLEVEPGSFLDGKEIDALQNQYDFDIVLHGHGGMVDVHPDGDVGVRAGDTLVIFAQHSKTMQIVAQNRPERSAKRN